MENLIYRITMESKADLEIFVCSTNELNPYRKIREIGVQLIIEEKQLDASLDINELNSLIKYLSQCRDYIFDFNNKSVPEDQNSMGKFFISDNPC